MIGWEDDLPWAKGDILIALLTLLKLATDNRQKDALVYGILYLDGFLPNEMEYTRRCATIGKIKSINKDMKSGLSTDDILGKYNGKK